MTLTNYQKANLRHHEHSSADIIDPSTGVTLVAGSTVSGVSDVPGLTAALAALQPLDSDLTAIAALSTTSIGRSLLAAADAAAIRSISGAETSGAAAAAQAASQPLDSDLTAIAALSTTSYGRAFLALADAAAGRTALGLGSAATSATTAFDAAGAASSAVAALSSVYQPLDSDLTSIAALSTTSTGRSLLAAADAAAIRTIAAAGSSTQTRSIEFVIDGGGSTITTGIKGDLEIPFACTITSAKLLADQSGSIVVNVWKQTYASYPATVSQKITASAPPTISSATKSSDSTLTGWTTAITAGDILRFNVDSATTITRVTLSLTVSVSV